MRRAISTLPVVLVGGLCVVGCAEQTSAGRPEPPTSAPTTQAPAPTRLVRGMAVPDQGVFPDCRGRFGEGSTVRYTADPAKPAPQNPEVVLETYFVEQRGRGRPEAPLYVLRNFERHDAKFFRGSTNPTELERHGRWIGYRPDDGSVFAVVLLNRVGADGGWVLAGDEGCSDRSPADRSPTLTPL